MKINKRSLVMVLSLVLAMSATAFGTVAFMSDRDTVTNTFTVGKVEIIVDEENVDQDPGSVDADGDGVLDIPARDTANDYKLVPGAVYTKDPTVTVKAGSEDCYVRMRVVMNNYSDLQLITGKTGAALLAEFVTIGDDWTLLGDGTVSATGEKITYEFRYKEVVAATVTDTPLQPLFKTFTVPGYFTANHLSMISDLKMDVWGDAIQTADSFESVDDAWAAFDAQNGLTGNVIAVDAGEDNADPQEPADGTTTQQGEDTTENQPTEGDANTNAQDGQNAEA